MPKKRGDPAHANAPRVCNETENPTAAAGNSAPNAVSSEAPRASQFPISEEATKTQSSSSNTSSDVRPTNNSNLAEAPPRPRLQAAPKDTPCTPSHKPKQKHTSTANRNKSSTAPRVSQQSQSSKFNSAASASPTLYGNCNQESCSSQSNNPTPDLVLIPPGGNADNWILRPIVQPTMGTDFFSRLLRGEPLTQEEMDNATDIDLYWPSSNDPSDDEDM